MPGPAAPEARAFRSAEDSPDGAADLGRGRRRAHDVPVQPQVHVQVEIVLELPNDRHIAEAYARGELLIDAVDGLGEKLSAAWQRIVAATRRLEVAS